MVPEPERADSPGTAGLDFLDFLFTFVLTFGLIPEAISDSRRGLLTEDWLFAQGRVLSLTDWTEIATLILALLTLTLSWFGYHASIRRNKIQFDHWAGLARFQFDVILILIYGLMLVNYKRFDIVMFLVVLIFLFFLMWDMLKAVEHGGPYGSAVTPSGESRPNHRREFVTQFWFLVVAAIAALNLAFPGQAIWWCVVAIGATIAYRVHKIVAFEQKLGVEPW